MNLTETTGETFFNLMQKKAIEVLTLATYVIDKIDNIKSRPNGSNTQAG